jgi:hypothetical protein
MKADRIAFIGRKNRGMLPLVVYSENADGHTAVRHWIVGRFSVDLRRYSGHRCILDCFQRRRKQMISLSIAKAIVIMALLAVLTALSIDVLTRGECARWEKSSSSTVLPMRCVERK